MKRASFTLILVAAAVASGCGARTGEEDLLGFEQYASGGRTSSDGGSVGIGGVGLPVGGTIGVGGTVPIGAGGVLIGVGGVMVGAGGLLTSGSCCSDRAGVPGCDTPRVQQCVCEFDPYCCTTSWDQSCAQQAPQCGAACGSGGSGGTSVGGAQAVGGAGGSPPRDSCCEFTGEAGCVDDAIEECVCRLDAYCCDTEWDQICITRGIRDCGSQCNGIGSGGAFSSGGASSGGTSSGGSGGTSPVGDCCERHSSPGCEIAAIEECVCADDAYCCGNSWDDVCVLGAQNRCGAACGPTGGGGSASVGGAPAAGGSGNPPFAGNCCDPHGSAGCESPSVQACVCATDSFCCETEWDNYCSAAAVTSCNANCEDVNECKTAFPSECGVCACEQCIADVNGCLGDFGCINIFACIQNTGCSGADCYLPITCQAQIDDAGGLTGTSAGRALDLVSCTSSADCPCR